MCVCVCIYINFELGVGSGVGGAGIRPQPARIFPITSRNALNPKPLTRSPKHQTAYRPRRRRVSWLCGAKPPDPGQGLGFGEQG